MSLVRRNAILFRKKRHYVQRVLVFLRSLFWCFRNGCPAFFLCRLPYFRRTQGRDHIFAFTSGMAVDGPFATWRNYIKDSIFIMAESELWNPYRNVNKRHSIYHPHNKTKNNFLNLKISKRLLFFLYLTFTDFYSPQSA